MATINPYLNFNGNCEEAFRFYSSVFGKEAPQIMKFKDAPADSGMPVAESDKDKVLHVSLPISKETILMGSDIPESMGQSAKPGSNFGIIISPESEEEARTLFNKLSEGGKVNMPLEKAFWGDLFGSVNDKFGIEWMVNYNPNGQG